MIVYKLRLNPSAMVDPELLEALARVARKWDLQLIEEDRPLSTLAEEGPSSGRSGRDNRLEREYEPHEIVEALTVTTAAILSHTERLGHVGATRLAELMGLKDGRYVGGAIAGLKRRCKNRHVKMPIEPRGKRGDREWYWVGWA